MARLHNSFGGFEAMLSASSWDSFRLIDSWCITKCFLDLYDDLEARTSQYSPNVSVRSYASLSIVERTVGSQTPRARYFNTLEAVTHYWCLLISIDCISSSSSYIASYCKSIVHGVVPRSIRFVLARPPSSRRRSR